MGVAGGYGDVARDGGVVVMETLAIALVLSILALGFLILFVEAIKAIFGAGGR